LRVTPFAILESAIETEVKTSPAVNGGKLYFPTGAGV
jgi:hypothetical protein